MNRNLKGQRHGGLEYASFCCDIIDKFQHINANLDESLNFQEWDSQNATQIITELCGFVTIVSGTFLLHKTLDMESSTTMSSPPYHTSPRLPEP